MAAKSEGAIRRKKIRDREYSRSEKGRAKKRANARKHFDPAREREWYLGRTYGISVKDYEELLAKQDFGCAICGTTDERVLHIDHDHITGEIRGLLCPACNLGVGNFRDNVDLLDRAGDYLGR